MSNKSIGKVSYSLAVRPSIPGDKNSEKKVYATVQSDESIELDLLSDHMSEHNSPFTEGTITGVLTDLAKHIVEQMLAGKRVHIPRLGTFYITLKSQAVDDAEDFNPAVHITAVVPHVRFEKATWDNIINKVDFELVTTLKEQAAAKKLAKQTMNAAMAGTSSGDDNGGDDGGDDNGQTE